MSATYALGAFILLAYTLEAVTGFGSIVIALSLGALLLPIEQLLPVLVPLNIGMTGSLVWRHRAQIDRFFALPTVGEIVAGLEADGSAWAAQTAAPKSAMSAVHTTASRRWTSARTPRTLPPSSART